MRNSLTFTEEPVKERRVINCLEAETKDIFLNTDESCYRNGNNFLNAFQEFLEWFTEELKSKTLHPRTEIWEVMTAVLACVRITEVTAISFSLRDHGGFHGSRPKPGTPVNRCRQ